LRSVTPCTPIATVPIASPIRVLHVVGGLSRAGTETWLVNVLRRLDRSRFDFAFLVHDITHEGYCDEVRRLGSDVLLCNARTPMNYALQLRGILKRRGPFHVIHGHLQHFNGVVLSAAASVGVPVRVAHSHLAARASDQSFPRLVYARGMASLISYFATNKLAASEPAAEALYGQRWREDPSVRVLHCGVDMSGFSDASDSTTVRREFGIPDDAFVIGHVGRLEHQKNHAFLLHVAAETFRKRPGYLLLVGEGSLRPAIEAQACNLGIRERTIFAGSRSDVPRLLAAMDAFVFPSHFEGLGLVLLEAQAAGLPITMSDVIPQEAVVFRELVREVSLNATAADWASTVLSDRLTARRTPDDARRDLLRSSFNIDRSARELMNFYDLATRRKAGTPCV
jgi:glycosyltransferase involved in cell wall biosynthesis